MHVFCKERFEDPKRGIGSRQSKDRQYNEQMKKDKNTNTRHYTAIWYLVKLYSIAYKIMTK
jgi:hypothetical protein